MLKGMTGKRRVVCFDVQFEVIEQIMLPQKGERCRRIEIILVLCGLGRFRLNQELPLEPDLLFVVDGHVEEPCHLLLLSLEIGIQ